MSRVFISYGRADSEALALLLEEDLSDQGHSVWLDRSEIKAGRAWEEQIEGGILRSDIVIALLSPYAVRRPDGVCLDEISLARYNQKWIIPAMVLPCRPPLGIYRLDWIDFRNWQVAANYDRAFGRLTSTLRERAESVEGTYAALFAQLKPMDFGNELSRLTRGFVGRQWLFDKINQWLTHDDSCLFLITGDPGIGKSAVLASLVNRHPRICAYHFCVADLANSLDPFLFVKSIAAQLATQFDSYRAVLESVDLQAECGADPGDLLRRLVLNPLRAEILDEPIVIVLDGLDESLGYLGRNIAKVISERLVDLPPSVRLVASSRDIPEILDLFSAYSPHPIDALDKENLGDTNTYLKGRLSEPKLRRLLESQALTVSEVRDTIFSKSNGNFLYLRHTMDAIRAGQLDPSLPDAFPVGLIGVYHAFFQWAFTKPDDYPKLRPLLDVIAVSREPLEPSQIGAFVRIAPFDVEQAMQQVADFFPERDGRYQAFHKSMTDWLLGTVGHSLRFRVNVQNGHELIASQCWSEFRHGVPTMSAYAVQHGLYHLHCAGRTTDKFRLAADPEFIRRRLSLGRGIFFSHSYRETESEIALRVAKDLSNEGHTLLVTIPTAEEDQWRKEIASAVASASVAIGFAYTRNSPYLREEWLLALASGVPLVLIVTEECPWLSSTPELAKVRCIDMPLWKNSEENYVSALASLLDLIGKADKRDTPLPTRESAIELQTQESFERYVKAITPKEVSLIDTTLDQK